MKQLGVFLIIVALIILAVYLFYEFFQAAQNVRSVKVDSEKVTAPNNGGSTDVYTGGIRKAKKAKSMVESNQAKMLEEKRNKEESANLKKSKHQMEKEREREEWYKQVTGQQ